MHAPQGGNNRYKDANTHTQSKETSLSEAAQPQAKWDRDKIYFYISAKARIVTNDDGNPSYSGC